ncbi:MAG TPA: hypothetical protein VMH88_14090 [Gemmatimonadales bacterium]|nr:hypothetical protein [Gemmatimonadales bacterium]
MTRRLLLFLSLVAPGAAVTQSANAPYTRYAAAIATKADSVVGFLTSQVGNLTNESAVATLATAAAQMKRLTDEFAGSEPPADLAAVHRDLVATLTLAASKAEHAATLMQTAMDTSILDEQRTTAAQTAQTELNDLQTAITSYDEARAQAARVLQQHGATLPGRS